jgi:ankyrin repeat protein
MQQLAHLMQKPAATLPALLAVLAVALHAGLGGSQAQAQVPPTPSEASAYTGLHAAAHRGDLVAIQKLATSAQALQARDAAGRTPLHVATFARQHATVQALLQAGADPAAFEQGRYDAVTIAAVADDEKTLQVLLAGGASARLTTSRYDGTALIAAAHLGHDGVVRQLIKAGAPLDHVNNLHWTAVIEAIVLGDGGSRHQSTLKALLDAGASLKLGDRQGQTPLQLARSRGYKEMVKMLEQAGAK